MRWFKIAAIGVGILIAFLIVGSVIGVILHAVIDVVIAAAVVGAIVVAVKVARSRKQVSAKKADREVREPDHREYNMPLPRADVDPQAARDTPRLDVEDDLARLKREMGSLALPVRRRRAWSPRPRCRPSGPGPRPGVPSPTW